MINCYSFNQPLDIPSSVTRIGSSFLSGCCSFNQPLDIPSSVTRIGSSFLSGCYSFNQPLDIPSSVTSIESSFLTNCYSFNHIVYNSTYKLSDNNSLSQQLNTKTDTTYGTGIKVTGEGADVLLDALPNRTSNPYRKLYKG